MDTAARPFRSVLYIPGSKPRALDKARSLPTDAIIFDLEDAVAADEKRTARETLAKTLNDADYGARMKIVRINSLDTPWGEDDARACAEMVPDAVLLPKVSSPRDLDALRALTGALPLWAMMETPSAILNANDIAAHPQLAGFVMGTNDLCKELQCASGGDRLALVASLSICVLAARAHGRIIVDGVFNAFKDDDGLRRECAQGRALGFDGKTLIHPAQLTIANELFAPSPEEAELARRQIEAYDAAISEGQGVAVLDGQIVENLHVVTARRTLAKIAAIDALGTE